MNLPFDPPRRRFWSTALLIGALACGLGGCDQLLNPGKGKVLKAADARAAEGDYPRAISLYESALDDTAQAADIHYRLALLYDDKMNAPLNALHHFKRYLALTPTGPRAAEVKNYMQRDELSLLTSLTGDAIVSRAEANRLKNENLSLRKQIEEGWDRAKSQQPAKTKTASKKSTADKSGASTHTKRRHPRSADQ